MNRQFATAEELSKMLNVPLTTVWRHTREGCWPHIVVGRCYRYDTDEVIAFLREETEPSDKETNSVVV